MRSIIVPAFNLTTRPYAASALLLAGLFTAACKLVFKVRARLLVVYMERLP